MGYRVCQGFSYPFSFPWQYAWCEGNTDTENMTSFQGSEEHFYCKPVGE
jgi:hypothetical protein